MSNHLTEQDYLQIKNRDNWDTIFHPLLFFSSGLLTVVQVSAVAELAISTGATNDFKSAFEAVVSHPDVLVLMYGLSYLGSVGVLALKGLRTNLEIRKS